jgi:hypothetical protein
MKESTLAKITASVAVAKEMAQKALATSPNPQWTEYEMQSVDEWIAPQDVKLNRSEAIRRLVEPRAEDQGLEMNPLDWKREHQFALALAAALGAFVCTLAMFHTVTSCASSFTGSTRFYPLFGIDWGPFLSGCWFQILIWPLAGSISGATIVYIRQLMRA